jgi:hypothetical protein
MAPRFSCGFCWLGMMRLAQLTLKVSLWYSWIHATAVLSLANPEQSAQPAGGDAGIRLARQPIQKSDREYL